MKSPREIMEALESVELLALGYSMDDSLRSEDEKQSERLISYVVRGCFEYVLGYQTERSEAVDIMVALECFSDREKEILRDLRERAIAKGELV